MYVNNILYFNVEFKNFNLIHFINQYTNNIRFGKLYFKFSN